MAKLTRRGRATTETPSLSGVQQRLKVCESRLAAAEGKIADLERTQTEIMESLQRLAKTMSALRGAGAAFQPVPKFQLPKGATGVFKPPPQNSHLRIAPETRREA